jgi:aminopeptidase YwaD
LVTPTLVFLLEKVVSIKIDNLYGNIVQDNDKHSEAVANFIKGVAEKYTNLNVTLGILGNSDYLPFEALGYTVIGFHDDGVTKNPDHHTTADTPDTLNYEYLTSTTKLVLATILNLDRLITTAADTPFNEISMTALKLALRYISSR